MVICLDGLAPYHEATWDDKPLATDVHNSHNIQDAIENCHVDGLL
jgi:hypothetical protein